MPRVAKELAALDVKRLKPPKEGVKGAAPVTVAVGGVAGLCLQLTPTGGRSWLLRVTVHGRRREMGLGPYPEVSLAEAKDAARDAKALVRQGLDPLAMKQKAKAEAMAEAARNITFSKALDAYCEVKLQELGSQKNRDAAENMLRTYAEPTLGKLPVADITVAMASASSTT